MRKRSQAIIAAMLALGMAVGMCGCEGQLPTPKATTRQDAPNLSAKQEQKVRTRILKTLDQFFVLCLCIFMISKRSTSAIRTVTLIRCRRFSKVRNWTSAPAS